MPFVFFSINKMTADVRNKRINIVKVGNSGVVGIGLGCEVGVTVGVWVGFGDEFCGVEVGVGVALEVLTVIVPSVIVADMGLTIPLTGGALRTVPYRDIEEEPVFRTLKLIVARTPVPLAVEGANRRSLTLVMKP